MIRIENIQPKSYKKFGVIHKPSNGNDTVYHAEIIPGKSIRIFGTYGNHINGPQTFDKTFKIGNSAEYDSYNLKYTGPIVKISKASVTINGKDTMRGNKRLDLNTFCWRNWDFNAGKIAANNNETMMYI